MSPVAGVGINFAIQDAVVATNVLAQPLRAGRVTESHLAEVQRQREWPTKVIQTMQAVFQKVLIERVFSAQGKAKVPLPLRLLVKIPYLRDVPGRMFAFGARRVRLLEPKIEVPRGGHSARRAPRGSQRIAVDAQLLHLGLQGGALHAQPCRCAGRPGQHAVGFAQHFEDVIPLAIAQRDPGHGVG